MSAKLDLVKIVTREHGEKFSDSWEKASWDSGSLTDASGDAHIMTWPNDEVGQNHYHEIEREIARRVYDELREDIIDTYVWIANEVLTRERRQLCGEPTP
jgi:hypothetical protein